MSLSESATVLAAGQESAGSTALRNRLVRPVLVIQAVAGYALIRMLMVGGPGAWPAASKDWIGPGHPSELKVLPYHKGYDGQWIYRLAIEPFTTHLTDHGITFDQGAYRQQRIMTALLAHILSTLPGISTGTALVLVNCAAVAVAVLAGLTLATDLDRSPWLGVLLGAPAGVITGLVADLTEPVAWAAVLVALVALRRRRWLVASVAFAVAMLARETAAIVVFGFVVETIVLVCKHGWRAERARLWLVLPVSLEVGWQLWLWHIWGTLPLLTGFRSTGLNPVLAQSLAPSQAPASSGLPFIGIAQTFLAGLVTGETGDVFMGVTDLIERVVLVALIAGAAWSLITRRSRPGFALTVAWCAAAAVALSLSSWSHDIQFLRAALEVSGLSVLVLMHSRTRWARVILLGTAAMTLWVAIYFWPRV